MRKISVGLCQMSVENDKNKNLKKAGEMIKYVSDRGSKLVTLPEMFNCPYDNKYFPDYAEKEGGLTTTFLSRMASDNKIFLIGGSIPEIDVQGNIFNTSFIFDPNGNIVSKHRKVHLFDVDIKNGISFKESDVLKPGDNITIFNTGICKIGVAICFDIRFADLIGKMSLEGAEIIVIPAAFNMTTGPAHWELTFRMRAIDNQVYMIGVSPARNINATYVAYGHSIITEPWGEVVDKLNEKEGVIIKTLDLDKIENLRQQLPILKNRRNDLY